MVVVQQAFRSAALRVRDELRGARVTPVCFSAALAQVPPSDRDLWLDCVWDIHDLPPDDPDLPRGCVPYLPCSVATVLDAVHHSGLSSDDVFVDVGAGAGRAALLAHLVSGASCIGLEIQASLARAAQSRADWLGLSRLRFVHGDAADTTRLITIGTVFFLYCPFTGERLQRFLDGLEDVARTRPIRVCCIDMPPLEAAWLTRVSSSSSNIDLYRSTAAESAPEIEC